MLKLIGQNFEDMKLKRNDKVKTMNPHSIKIRYEVVIDPRQLLNRIMCTATSQEQLEQCFEYELSTEATSMFENFGMRKTKKSALFEVFDKLLKDVPLVEPIGRKLYFIDGGFLLHKVVWAASQTYEEIYDSYEKYISSHYGRRTHIIFDGYSDRQSTKYQEQQRRAGSMACVDILFEDNMVPKVAQSKFLTNPKNKSRFIVRLSALLIARGHSITQCEGDADTSIVHTALPYCEAENSSYVVVSEDIDILVLLLHKCESPNVFMLRSFGLHNMIPIKTLQRALGHGITSRLFFMHAVSGGDKTSAFKGKGKASAFKIIQKNKPLAEELQIFYDTGADRNRLCNVGESFVLRLYGAHKDVISINKLRYVKFNQINARKSLTKEIDIALLPPTKNALNQHIFRVYHQVQEWCGNKLNPLEWGWVMKGNVLIPNQGVVDVAPRFVLDLIFCNCKKSSCQTLCSCKKVGLKCTAQCGHCCGIFCTNKIEIDEDFNEIE